MRARHLGLIGLLVLIDSLCFVAIEIGTRDVPPLRFAGLRAGLGGLTLLVGSLLFGAPIVPARRLWSGVVGLALLSTTIGYSAMFLSPHATGAGIASVVGNTGPLFLVLFGAVLLRERLTRAKIEALGLAVVGIGLIAISQSAADTGPIDLGFLVPLGAAVAAAAATVLLKSLEPGRDVVPVAMWQLMLGSLPILAVSQFVEPSSQGAWTTSSLLVLAFLAVAGTAAGVSIWYWLVDKEEVVRLGILMFAIPVLGLTASWVLLGDEPSGMAKVGIVAALIGLLRISVDPASGAPLHKTSDVELGEGTFP